MSVKADAKATAAKTAGAPPAKKLKTDEAKQHNDMSTYFTRITTGKVVKATPEMIEQATLGLQMLKKGTMTKEQKVEFTELFKENKGQKNNNWVKEFKAQLTIAKTECDRVLENYCTRTSGGQSIDSHAGSSQG